MFFKRKGRDFYKDRKAYLRMKKDLLASHSGEFVAIYKGELLATHPDKIALIGQVRREIGSVCALIQKIEKEEPRIKLPTSRRIGGSSQRH